MAAAAPLQNPIGQPLGLDSSVFIGYRMKERVFPKPMVINLASVLPGGTALSYLALLHGVLLGLGSGQH